MPACHAAVIVKVLPSVVAIPLRGADPTILSLVGREDRRSNLIETLLAVAHKLVEDGADDLPPVNA